MVGDFIIPRASSMMPPVPVTAAPPPATLLRMTMTTCRECSHNVSDQALACPRCGSPRATERGRMSYGMRELGKLLLAMLVLGLLLAAIS